MRAAIQLRKKAGPKAFPHGVWSRLWRNRMATLLSSTERENPPVKRMKTNWRIRMGDIRRRARLASRIERNALQKGMEEKSREFPEKRSKIYARE